MTLTSHSTLVALVTLVPCHAIALGASPARPATVLRPAQFSRRAAVRCSEDDDLVALLVDDDAFDDDDGGDLKPPPPPAPPAPPALPDGEVVLETLEHGAKAMRVGVAGKELSFETGEIGRLASGTVVCKSGGTHVLSAACFERKDEVTPLDFTPLRVDYIERKSSVGRTAGGYIKRDGRPSDHETLVCRLIDRPLRPLLGNGWSLETQLTSYVLAADGEHLPDVMAICSASAALAVSQVPFAKPVAAVRVVLVGDELVVNPTKAEVAAGGGKLDLVVATPGRLLDLMGQGHVDLSQVETFILDEADRMLDMGFIPDIEKVIARLSEDRRNGFSSATVPKAVEELAGKILVNPVQVKIDPEKPTVDKIDQRVLYVDRAKKDDLLIDMIRRRKIKRAIVFVKMKYRASRVCDRLGRAGISSEPIHGNKSQAARTRALEQFKKGKVKVLVATDIAARGIDVDDITDVFNYDLPVEAETYVHRIGRTGRAGKSGLATSLFVPGDEPKVGNGALWAPLAQLLEENGQEVPRWFDDARPRSAAPRPSQQQPSARRKGASNNRRARRAAAAAAAGRPPNAGPPGAVAPQKAKAGE